VSNVVLVTGASRYMGAAIAGRLASDERVGHVIGVDTTMPSDETTALLGRAEFIHADIRHPLIGRILAQTEPDTVVHMAVVASPARAGGRAAMKEVNVIGTMQLLAACQKTPSVSKLVVKSSVAAYGASSRDPALFTEETEPRAMPRGGYAKDIVEIEGYVRGFARRRPDVTVTVLRFAPFVGARANTTLTRYFSLPVVPTVFGRDPRVQFVHVDDALEVLHRSVLEHHPGVFNVAGPGVLSLSQAIRRAGRVPLPVPDVGLSVVAALARHSGLIDFSLDQIDFLVHGRVVDTTRLKEEFGYLPRRTVDAFDDFIRGHDLASVLSPENVKAVERTILEWIRHARR